MQQKTSWGVKGSLRLVYYYEVGEKEAVVVGVWVPDKIMTLVLPGFYLLCCF